ncbi:MAG: hypothetical protein H0V87_04020 [Chloroflexi bacterium]|nr:hypothetical protein [Chloroflexota bacterium]
MRLRDLLHPHLDGISSVVECHAGSLTLEPYLQLPDGVAYARCAPDAAPERFPADQLPIGILGPDAGRHGDPDDAIGLIPRLPPGGRALILFGFPSATLPFHRLLDALSRASCQVLQLASLDYDHVYSGALVASTDRLQVPRDPLGDPIASDDGSGPQLGLELRIANEYIFTDFVSRGLRVRLFDLEEQVRERPLPPAPSAADAPVGPAGENRRSGTPGGDHASPVPGPQTVVGTPGAVPPTADAPPDSPPPPADAQDATAPLADLRARDEANRAAVDADRAAVDAARGEAERARAETERIAQSTSYRLGRTIVTAARTPSRLRRLPGDLGRIWRNRGVAERAAASRAAEKPRPKPKPAARTGSAGASSAATADPAETEVRRFLAHTALAMTPRRRPVIAGILRHETAGALAAGSTVSVMTPNDALLVLERVDPDVFLVETAAFAPSRPWAYGGTAAAVERDGRVMELIDRAHRQGRPAVLVRDERAVDAAGLQPLEARFDLVLGRSEGDAGAGEADAGGAWSRGVSLERFNPIGEPPDRRSEPLFVGRIDPRASAARRRWTVAALGALVDQQLEIRLDPLDPDGADGLPPELRGAVRGVAPWDETPELYRATGVILAEPVTAGSRGGVLAPRTLEQLACGARVISGPNDALASAGLGSSVTMVEEVAAIGRLVRAAAVEGLPSDAGLRDMLRVLFQQHASPVMLARIIRALGGLSDPLAGRSVAAVAALGSESDPAAVIDSLLQQAHRPNEVVLIGTPSITAVGARPLEEAGMAVQAVDEAALDRGWSSILEELDSEWVALWPRRGNPDPGHLLDLVVGGEMSRADAVAYDATDGLRFVPGLDLRAGIVRRTLLAQRSASIPGPTDADTGLPDTLADGWRVFSVGAERSA